MTIGTLVQYLFFEPHYESSIEDWVEQLRSTFQDYGFNVTSMASHAIFFVSNQYLLDKTNVRSVMAIERGNHDNKLVILISALMYSFDHARLIFNSISDMEKHSNYVELLSMRKVVTDSMDHTWPICKSIKNDSILKVSSLIDSLNIKDMAMSKMYYDSNSYNQEILEFIPISMKNRILHHIINMIKHIKPFESVNHFLSESNKNDNLIDSESYDFDDIISLLDDTEKAKHVISITSIYRFIS